MIKNPCEEASCILGSSIFYSHLRNLKQFRIYRERVRITKIRTSKIQNENIKSQKNLSKDQNIKSIH